MSGDVDLTQLLADDIAIYELNKKKFITKDNFKDYFGYHYENTLVKKIFCGDNSDNIGNIKGLSDVGFANLMPEFRTKKVTVENVLERTKELITERLNAKKKPLKVYENIINGISNKPYSGDFYEINQKIIDLKHPLLTDEAKKVMDSMMYAPQDPNGRSFGNLYGYILEDGITDLMSNTRFASFFSPFKRLEEKEISRFKESLKQ
jgi:5'-3' exonuclease